MLNSLLLPKDVKASRSVSTSFVQISMKSSDTWLSLFTAVDRILINWQPLSIELNNLAQSLVSRRLDDVSIIIQDTKSTRSIACRSMRSEECVSCPSRSDRYKEVVFRF